MLSSLHADSLSVGTDKVVSDQGALWNYSLLFPSSVSSMKRGFLLKAEAKKAAAKRAQKQAEPSLSPTASSTPQNLTSFDAHKQSTGFVRTLPNGNLRNEENALPSDYDHSSKLVIKNTDHTIPDAKNCVVRVVTIPQPVPDGETQCEWIVNGSTKAKVVNAPGYPARIPKPRCPDLYEVRSTPDMGEGVFAKRDISHGELIFAERPLLVTPRAVPNCLQNPIPKHYTEQQVKQVVVFEYEKLLEYAVGRLSTESQADLRALHNSHTGDGSGPIFGINRTNSYGIDLYDGPVKTDVNRYGALCKIGSRINHSCMPNVRYSFKLNSFSVQFYALRDIKAGEQLVYIYCLAISPAAKRQAELAPYGFVCKCPACINATPETDLLRTTFRKKIVFLSKGMGSSSRIDQATLDDALRLEKAMLKEGLDGEPLFVELLAVIWLAYQEDSEERRRYGIRLDKFKAVNDLCRTS